MPALEQARQILENILGYLGFFVTVEEDPNSPDGPTLQILTEESDRLIGKRGEVLDDLQYLVNRLLMRRSPDAPRIRVDVEYYRSMREDKMLEKAKQEAEMVKPHRQAQRAAADEIATTAASFTTPSSTIPTSPPKARRATSASSASP